jgi:putative transposase
MRSFINPLLLWAAHAHRADLIRQVQYLKVENEILRSRLGRRILVSPNERQRLVKYARSVGAAIRPLVSIVAPDTMRRWLRGPDQSKTKRAHLRKAGRPRTPSDVEQLVVRIARETGWGYTRILGELKKLGVRSISRATIVNILKRAGLDPSPERKRATWDQFIKRHAETLWACDFLPRRILTTVGWRDAFVLVFIHLSSRRVWISPSSLKTDGDWTARQTSAFLQECRENLESPLLVIRDNDARFRGRFHQALAAHQAQGIRLRMCSPNLNAYAERFIQTLQRECLDHFVVFGCKHMDYLMKEFVEHYHTERPHQALGNEPLARAAPRGHCDGRVVCRSRLGGVLRHYRRAA